MEKGENTQSAALSLQHLCKDYDGKRVVNKVSLEVFPGEVFGLLGPNGAGKTTTISMVTTLIPPTEGCIKVFGYDIQQQPMLAKQKMGVVPQEIVNHGYFSVEEILEFQSGYYGLWRNRDRIHYLCDKLQLAPHRHKKVKQLSGGMKRRLMIAKALVHSPKLLLLDEPTAGVDIELRSGLWKFVEELRSDGVAVLLTTHYLEEAEKLCDRVAVIHKGQIVKLDKTKNMINELTQKQVVLSFIDGFVPKAVAEFQDALAGRYTYSVSADLPVGDLLNRAEIPSHAIKNLQILEGTLEGAFLSLVSGGQS